MCPQPELQSRYTPGAQVRNIGRNHWWLEIPPGPAGCYRLAQLDDYGRRRRSSFLWQPPLTLSLRARVSHRTLPGTWGFGFWNDPFTVSIGLKGASRCLPALPNAAWFFYASPPSHLSLRNHHPARGFLAATFSSRDMPSVIVAAAVPLLPLLMLSRTATLLRSLARHFVSEAASLVSASPDQWHCYRLEWREDIVRFWCDSEMCLETELVPRPPLGLVIWIDNQYAALPPMSRLRFGTLPTTDSSWLEVADLELEAL